MAAAAAIDPGHGSLEGGLKYDASSGPAAYLQYEQRLDNGLALFAGGQASNLHDYSASAGLKWTW